MQFSENGLRCSNFGSQSLTVADAPTIAAPTMRPATDAAPTTRPATDAAPTTLDGLLELIGAIEAERAYFTERQLELNA